MSRLMGLVISFRTIDNVKNQTYLDAFLTEKVHELCNDLIDNARLI